MHVILSNWPLAFICAAMIIAALIDGWKLKVPNWLTLPLVVSGWLLGLGHNLGLLPESTGVGGLGASLAGTVLGFILLYPVYAIGGMGGGDVKMQMGFGSWIGAFYGLNATDTQPGALSIIFWAFCLGVVIGGVIALGMIFVRGNLRTNLANVRAILGDLAAARGVEDVTTKAQ